MRGRSRVLAALAPLLLATAAGATTVSDFSVEDLVRFARLGVRARVVGVSPVGGVVRYELAVRDVLLGASDPSRLSVELEQDVEGVPVLRPGDELVLFLNLENRVERIIGLRWGTYRIRGEELLDYDGRPLELRTERRSGQTRVFLRPTPDKRAPGLPYQQLKRQVRDLEAASGEYRSP